MSEATGQGDWTPTRAQQVRLRAGDYRPFIFETKPDCEPGSGFVFVWSRPRRHCDPETGQVFDAPEAPAAWIKVTKIVRQTRHWVVHFDVIDKRHLSLLLAPGSGYTTHKRIAIDHVEAVLSDDDKRRYEVDARAARVVQLEHSTEARRRQERAIRSRLRETLQTLSPVAQTTLLSEIERMLEAAGAGEQQAA